MNNIVWFKKEQKQVLGSQMEMFMQDFMSRYKHAVPVSLERQIDPNLNYSLELRVHLPTSNHIILIECLDKPVQFDFTTEE